VKINRQHTAVEVRTHRAVSRDTELAQMTLVIISNVTDAIQLTIYDYDILVFYGNLCHFQGITIILEIMAHARFSFVVVSFVVTNVAFSQDISSGHVFESTSKF